MTVRYKRLLDASNIKNGQIFTNFCNHEAEANKIWARTNTVRLSSNFEGEVQQRVDRKVGNNKIYIVNRKQPKSIPLIFIFHGLINRIGCCVVM